MAANSRTNLKKNNLSKTKTVSKKKRKLKIGAILIFLILISCLMTIIFGILSKPITNIYISGNSYLSDQDIIEIANLQNYPSALKNMSIVIKKRLKDNILIKDASVRKKWFTKVYIEVTENRPLFFNSTINQTVLLDGSSISDKMECATLINYVPDTIYSSFISAMKEVNDDILQRTSEIIYDPNDVDEGRFLFIMDDGNYVYLTLNKFKSINNYINIIKKFESKKGILYLDSGEYFKILDN